MNYARDAILTLTICSLIYIADNWPRPVKDNQAPFCVVIVKQAYKDQETGQWHIGWGPMYRPCQEQDKFFWT